MADPRTDDAAHFLASVMDEVKQDPEHPTNMGLTWLKEQAGGYLTGRRLVDFACGDGSKFCDILQQGFQGVAYPIDAQKSMLTGLLERLEREPISGVTIVPIWADVSDVLQQGEVYVVRDSDGTVERVKNPVRAGSFDVGLCTEFTHEAFSLKALSKSCIGEGFDDYLKIMETMAGALAPGGVLLYMDLHGCGFTERVYHSTEGREGKVAEHLINWVADPNYSIPQELLAPGSEGFQNIWTRDGARETLTRLVMGHQENVVTTEGILANVLAEAVYRNLRGYAHDDAEAHACLNWGGIRSRFEGDGLEVVDEMHVRDGQAKQFLQKYGGIVVDAPKFPALYSAAVLRKTE